MASKKALQAQIDWLTLEVHRLKQNARAVTFLPRTEDVAPKNRGVFHESKGTYAAPYYTYTVEYTEIEED